MTDARPLVIVLHGIFRTAWSMKIYELALRWQGYAVLNVTYPSLRHDLGKIAELTEAKIMRSPKIGRATKIHFVTHSMGGLITRYMLDRSPSLREKTASIVMLNPPNQGSEVADFAKSTGWMSPLYRFFYGPAGQQLTTEHAVHHPPLRDIPVGVIAGGKSGNPFAHHAFGHDQKHDGTVAHNRMRLDESTPFVEVHATHNSILCSPAAIRQTLHFLHERKFKS